ncbi:MAG: hypothetical protein KAG66_24535, partial [Methylococcales bacterium]|nr:hypothetical protein [Methylococcales bacterium]
TDWAIEQALSWRNETMVPNLFHIQGSHDRIFPTTYIDKCIPIEGGTHLMLLNKAAQISRIMLKIVAKIARNQAGGCPVEEPEPASKMQLEPA